MRVLITLVRGLEMPVNEFPYTSHGACPFLCPWSALRICLLHMYNNCNCAVVRYCRYIKNDDHHERTTVEIPFNIMDYRARNKGI